MQQPGNRGTNKTVMNSGILTGLNYVNDQLYYSHCGHLQQWNFNFITKQKLNCADWFIRRGYFCPSQFVIIIFSVERTELTLQLVNKLLRWENVFLLIL